MKLIIFGEINKWTDAVNLLSKYRKDIQICGLCSLDLGSFIDSDATVTLRETVELLKKGSIDTVLNINGENPYFFRILKQIGITNIHVLPSYLYFQDKSNTLSPTENFIYPYEEIGPELMQLEFHLADHCNLNCKGCTHFSNLVPAPVFADLEQFKNDIKRLSELFSHIHTLYLLGGEPLLNKDIEHYIYSIKKYFPFTQITIVTNGLLLLTMKSELISAILENHVHLSISDYNCLDHEKITAFIRKHQLSADLRIEKDLFSKFINLKGNSNHKQIFEQCPRKNCTFLDKGRIAACCLPFVAKYFNQYFDENIPELESIDLYELNITGHDIQARLITPMELCKYCSEDVSYEWEISHPPYTKEDWCI